MICALVDAEDIIANRITLSPERLVDIPAVSVYDSVDGSTRQYAGIPAWKPPQGFAVHPAEGLRFEIGWQWNNGSPRPVPLPDHVSLGMAKQRALEEVAAATEAAISAGVMFDGVRFQIDTLSQGRIAARVIFARACIDGSEEWPEDFGWIAADNSRPTMTAQEFWDFAVAAMARVTMITLQARDLKDAIVAAPTLEAVSQIAVTIE